MINNREKTAFNAIHFPLREEKWEKNTYKIKSRESVNEGASSSFAVYGAGSMGSGLSGILDINNFVDFQTDEFVTGLSIKNNRNKRELHLVPKELGVLLHRKKYEEWLSSLTKEEHLEWTNILNYAGKFYKSDKVKNKIVMLPPLNFEEKVMESFISLLQIEDLDNKILRELGLKNDNR